MRCSFAPGLLALGLLVSTQRTIGATDEQTLRAANLGTDGPALLDFFRKHTLTATDRQHIQRLIGQLGDRSFRLREKASTELIEEGPRAIALLRAALKHPDREVARRAEDCLRKLEAGTKKTPPPAPALWMSAARLLAVHKPAGTAEALLNYLPFADSEAAIEEIQTTLVAVAVRAGKVEPDLVKALTAAEPLRRALAGVALARAGVADQKNAVRKLLLDPEAGVRLRIGLTLAVARDRNAVPVLIDLLGHLPPEQAWAVEDLLSRLAEGKAPAVRLGTDDAGRGKCRDAWAAWWREHGTAVKLDALEAPRRRLGYALVVIPDYGLVYELDRDGKVRWRLDRLQVPFEAHLLPGERLLVAEAGGGRVTERNLKGEILWQHGIPDIKQCQRLANGNTFVITAQRLLEIDPAGKEKVLHRHTRFGSVMLAARKLRNGQIVLIENDGKGTCVTLDATGRELVRFDVGRISNNCLDVLPNGHILVPKFFEGKVTEYDPRGKVVWEVPFPSAFSAHRLPNGNTIVACHEPTRVVELDRVGKVVWQHICESPNHRPWFGSGR